MAEEILVVPEAPKIEITKETPPMGGAVEGVIQPEVRTEHFSERIAEKYAQLLSKVGKHATPVSPQAVASDAAALSDVTDTASTVTRLVALAETKGVAHAVHVAQKLNDLYVLDTMHDELADKLYDALKAKGLIIEG